MGAVKRREEEQQQHHHCSMSCTCPCSLLLPSSKTPLLLFTVLLLLASNIITVTAGMTGRPVSALKMSRIQSHLRRINKPAVRSIQSLDGDIIDCVQRHKQPAMDHPLLKNHKIQRVPSKIPTLKGGRPAVNYSEAQSGRKAWQTWHHEGHCPKGTVPIRRTTADDVLRARSVFHYGRKQVVTTAPPLARAVDAPDVITGNGHEHAIAYTGSSQAVYGAKATINVWDPAIQESNGFSLSQLWILSGSFNGSDLNSIEAGWQVSPELYGDSKPRLFTYWTSDAYQVTGCYNALCPGFVQTSDKIAIGASISPVSSAGSSQYDITILIWKDPKLGNWWLSYGDSDNLVGYWPAELFTHLSDHATMVEWGGEVVNTRPNGVHTATQMGSGRFASEGFGRASYFRNLETVDEDNSLSAVPFEAVMTLAEDASCYNIQKAFDDRWGTHFYYGGPGHSPSCL